MDLGKINIVEESLVDFGFRKQAPQLVILNLEED